MKSFKITLMAFVVSFTAFQLHGQNWEIINPGYISNYQYSDSEYYLSNSLWVDSVEAQGSDTILYLNRRAVRDSIYLLANQPHFLQRKAMVTDSLVYFYDTASYVIKRYFDVGGSWLFDTTNNIVATCTDKFNVTTFGFADSVKRIVLSNNDTILLSKNYGILQFPDLWTGERYMLRGIDNLQVGEVSPKFADFFTFSVGDVFVYQRMSGDPGSHSDRFDRYTILDILSQTDSISYKVKDDYWHHIDLNPWPYLHEAGTDTITLTYKPEDYLLSEFYNDQLIVDYDEDMLTFVQPSQEDPYFSFSHVFEDELSILTKKIGFIPYWSSESSIFLESLMIDTLLMYSWNNANYLQNIKVGLGLYEEIWEYFEMGWGIKLLAWQTQTSSYGNLDTVPVWWLGQPEIEMDRVSIYPNPSTGIVHISGLQSGPTQLSIYDISGKLILERQIESHETSLLLDGITNGVYIMLLTNKHETFRKKLVIQRE